ncbi:hypothetical protein LOTGIDRAFT_228872 [Lottia gigantea]|uniref:SAM domain-containing protein n=1 Tax=Lottia gigantea TaxID=225164 RepID=V4A497_LOTGI|nr:hypothetical protein LOTGIDRAFT_228872 [Lottia gigantea]ESO91512.1 hypothetical protein LOTGIDRAFT_228872 [Lottia gigantea]
MSFKHGLANNFLHENVARLSQSILVNIMDKLEKILIMSQLDNLYPNFVKERVSIEDIPDLSDKELNDLGVKTIRDKVRLKKLCRSSLIGESSRRDRDVNTDQTDCHTVMPVEEKQNIQSSENSWSGQESSTMVVPDYTGYSSSQPLDSSAAPADDPNFDLAPGAQVDIGDRDNVYRTGDRVNADEIENVQTELGAASAQTQSNSQYRLPQNARFRLGEGAVFNMSNRNNTEHRGSEINARRIGTYSSRLR